MTEGGSDKGLPARRGRLDPTAPITRRPKARLLDVSDEPRVEGDVVFADFLPVARQVIETPPATFYRSVAYVLCGLILVAIGASIVGHLRLFAVAPGQIGPRGGSQVVEPREPGQVKSIDVANGAHVKKGDVVLTFDPTAALAAKTVIVSELADARAEVLRRTAAVTAAGPSDIDTHAAVAWTVDIPADVRARQEAVLHADLAQLAAVLTDLRASRAAKEAARDKFVANIAAQKALIASRTERTAMHEQLAAQGWDSRAMVLQSLEPLRKEQVTLVTLEGSRDEANAAIPVIDEKIAEARASFVSDNTAKQAAAERQVAALVQQLAKADLTLANMTLRAPVSGTVQSLAVTSTGQALKIGEQVMQVVPDGMPLEVQAYVLNTDIGFVRPGQPATIKIDTFPYTRYGTIPGHVTYVGADAITGNFAVSQQKNEAVTPSTGQLSVTNAAQPTKDLVFPVTVVPDRTSIKVDGRDVPLTSGMSVVVEIETARQRVISYVLYPLTRVFSGSAVPVK
jgi:hemolysin D